MEHLAGGVWVGGLGVGGEEGVVDDGVRWAAGESLEGEAVELKAEKVVGLGRRGFDEGRKEKGELLMSSLLIMGLEEELGMDVTLVECEGMVV